MDDSALRDVRARKQAAGLGGVDALIGERLDEEPVDDVDLAA